MIDDETSVQRANREESGHRVVRSRPLSSRNSFTGLSRPVTRLRSESVR